MKKIGKPVKAIGVFRKLHYCLPRSSLLAISKSFARSYLEYGETIYDQQLNITFSSKIESVQYNAKIAITKAIIDLSRRKLNKKLELELLHYRRGTSLCLYYEVL